MAKKTPIEMERIKISKTIRTLVRLKHSLAADEEINNLLPDTLDEFDRAIQLGEIKELAFTIDEVLNATNKRKA